MKFYTKNINKFVAKFIKYQMQIKIWSIAVLLIVGGAFEVAAQTFPVTVDIRWKIEDTISPDRATETLIFLGQTPLVKQQPAFIIPVDFTGPQPFVKSIAINRQLCFALGTRNAYGTTIDPTVWCHPFPWKGDCKWWANLDGNPGHSLADFGVVKRRAIPEDLVYWFGLISHYGWRQSCP